ncbi:hypothetical protein [Mesorhizobium sp. B2-7-2]|nr:hypothetical protein [Mesorhizobium sp. B2-7-2]
MPIMVRPAMIASLEFPESRASAMFRRRRDIASEEHLRRKRWKRRLLPKSPWQNTLFSRNSSETRRLGADLA